MLSKNNVLLNIETKKGQLERMHRMWLKSKKDINMRSVTVLVLADARHIFGILY